jgi:hypothetical protein
VEVATGARRLFKSIAPRDLAGFHPVAEICLTPDGRSYFYSFARVLSQLYVARRLR